MIKNFRQLTRHLPACWSPFSGACRWVLGLYPPPTPVEVRKLPKSVPWK